MADELQDSQESAKNPEETETSENLESQTDGDSPDPSDGVEDVEKQPSDYYEAELQRLKADAEEKQKKLDEKDRQIEIKNRALQAEKKKKVDTDLTDRDSLKREVLAEIRLESELDRISKSKAEREVVMHHYKSSIQRTGDVQEDLRRAVAVANAGRVSELLARERSEDDSLEASAASMLGGGNMRGNRPTSTLQSNARKEAEAILKNIKRQGFDGAKAVKHLDNYLR